MQRQIASLLAWVAAAAPMALLPRDLGRQELQMQTISGEVHHVLHDAHGVSIAMVPRPTALHPVSEKCWSGLGSWALHVDWKYVFTVFGGGLKTLYIHCIWIRFRTIQVFCIYIVFRKWARYTVYTLYSGRSGLYFQSRVRG